MERKFDYWLLHRNQMLVQLVKSNGTRLAWSRRQVQGIAVACRKKRRHHHRQELLTFRHFRYASMREILLFVVRARVPSVGRRLPSKSQGRLTWGRSCPHPPHTIYSLLSTIYCLLSTVHCPPSTLCRYSLHSFAEHYFNAMYCSPSNCVGVPYPLIW